MCSRRSLQRLMEKIKGGRSWDCSMWKQMLGPFWSLCPQRRINIWVKCIKQSRGVCSGVFLWRTISRKSETQNPPWTFLPPERWTFPNVPTWGCKWISALKSRHSERWGCGGRDAKGGQQSLSVRGSRTVELLEHQLGKLQVIAEAAEIQFRFCLKG